MFVKFLSNITTAKVLQGKPPVPGPNNVSYLTLGGGGGGGGKKLSSTSISYINPLITTIITAASNTSYSSTAPYLSLILSSVYHSMAYSSLSAVLNILRNCEQAQMYQIIMDKDLDLIGIILGFVNKVCCFFLPGPHDSNSVKPQGSSLSPHYFPSFLVKAMNVLEVCVNG
jgi:hypothetical protein